MRHAPSNGGRAGAGGAIIFYEIGILQSNFFIFVDALFPYIYCEIPGNETGPGSRTRYRIQ